MTTLLPLSLWRYFLNTTPRKAPQADKCERPQLLFGSDIPPEDGSEKKKPFDILEVARRHQELMADGVSDEVARYQAFAEQGIEIQPGE